MASHIGKKRLEGLSDSIRKDLIAMRHNSGLSQAELGRRVGLPQVHISGIETGKVVPRFNTPLELVRLLEYDLLLVPRSLVPIVQALVRDQNTGYDSNAAGGERPLYAKDEESRWSNDS